MLSIEIYRSQTMRHPSNALTQSIRLNCCKSETNHKHTEFSSFLVHLAIPLNCECYHAIAQNVLFIGVKSLLPHVFGYWWIILLVTSSWHKSNCKAFLVSDRTADFVLVFSKMICVESHRTFLWLSRISSRGSALLCRSSIDDAAAFLIFDWFDVVLRRNLN